MSRDDHLLAPAGIRQRGPEPTGARLLLIRHGECWANALGVAGGPRGDGGLTPKGRRQAEALRARLRASGELADARALYTSTMPRAVETAAILGDALPTHLVPRAEDDLCEVSVGEGDGLTWAELAQRFGVPNWDEDPDAVMAPGGESLRGFFERCSRALLRLATRHPGELVVIVAHGGVIEQALKMYHGYDAATRMAPRIENCSMTEFEYRDGRWRLLRYNDLAPLAANGLEELGDVEGHVQ